MTVVNPKSISGINSITTGSGSDNLLTIHTSDASSTERVRINSSGDVIVGSGITVSPDGNIFATGITTVGTGLSMADNVPASFGDSGDLKISHNGSDSLLQDSGTGNLKLISNGSGIILEKSNAEPMVRAYTDGAVELFHDNSKKLETTSGGVTLTGDFSIDDKIIHTGDTNTALRFPAADTITAETAGEERLRINSSGNVGLGQASPSSLLHLQDLSANGYELKLSGNSVSFNRTSLSYIDQLNDTGSLVFRMTSSYTNALTIASNGNITANAGNIVIGTSGKGIDFSATSDGSGTTSSEVLDEYEEGSFDVNYKTGGAGSNTLSAASYATTGGLYTKIGNMVHFQIRIKCSSHTTVGGQIVIEGLPFTHVSTTIASGAYICASQMLSGSNNARLIISTTQIEFQNLDGTALQSGAGGLNFNNEFHCAGSYIAA